MACMNFASLLQDQRKTVLLKGGNPACHRLLTNREYLDGKVWKPQNKGTQLSDAKIRRWRFGESNPKSIHKTILIVGETGTGKTTLINTMVNHMLGVKFEDKVWFEITEEEKEERDQAESQTTAITVYQVYTDDNPNSLTIIDTPGYGDTRGVEHDNVIPGLLLKLFASYGGVSSLDSVGLVIKATQNRLTGPQKYIFDAVLSVFGKDLEENIVIFITHSDGLAPDDALNAIKKAQIPCPKDVNGGPAHFMFNNRQSEQYKEKQKRTYQTIWEMGYDSLNDFFKSLKSTSGINLKMTEEVLTQRVQLEARVSNLQQRIATQNNLQEELKPIKEVLQANKDKLDRNENFEFEVDETQKDLVKIADQFKGCKQEATHCTTCKENCHFPGCGVSKDKLRRCRAFKNEKCTVCTGRCSFKDHEKDTYIYAQVTRKVKKTAFNLIQNYKEEFGKNVSLEAGIEQKLEDSKKEESRLVVEVYETIMQLQEIALKKEAMSIVVHLHFLIDKLKETGHPEKAKKLEEINDRTPPVSTETNTFYKGLNGFKKLWK